jgi:hypothetical protein
MAVRPKSEMTMASVREKVDECRFFLGLAQERNGGGDHVKFGYFISAFLCSFGSIFDRLEHFIKRSGVNKLLSNHPGWKYLGERLRNNEVHNVGGASYVHAKIRNVQRPRRRSRFDPQFSNDKSRFGLVWVGGQYDKEAAYGLVQFCSRCVSEVELYLGERGDLNAAPSNAKVNS